MQYRNRGQWRRGKPCGGLSHVHIPVYTEDESREDLEELLEHYHDHRDPCECFCEDFCRRFCPAFCRDFCSDVRDVICEKKKRKKRCKKKRGSKREGTCGEGSCATESAGEVRAAGTGGFFGCFRRRESCREVACRTCQWVFCEMGRVCPSNFCRCFAADFCREFCREFEEVRKLLCESKRGRREICCHGCREICQRVCPCACRKNCCLVPIA